MRKKKREELLGCADSGLFLSLFLFSFLTFLLHRHNLDGGVKQTPKHSFRCDSKRRTSNTSATSVSALRKKKRLASHQSNTISDLLTFKHIQKDNRIIYDVVPRDIIRSIRNQTQKHFYLLSAWQTGFAWTIMEPLFDLFFYVQIDEFDCLIKSEISVLSREANYLVCNTLLRCD